MSPQSKRLSPAALNIPCQPNVLGLSRAALGQKRQVQALLSAMQTTIQTSCQASDGKNGASFQCLEFTPTLLGRICWSRFLPLSWLIGKKMAANLTPLAPNAIVSCGRLAGRLNARLSSKIKLSQACAAIHIELPRKEIEAFDLVIAPRHDLDGKSQHQTQRRPKFFPTFGALNPHQSDAAGKALPPHAAINSRRRLRVALLVGGPTNSGIINTSITLLHLLGLGLFGKIKNTPAELMTQRWLARLMADIDEILTKQSGELALWITFSRRTPAWVSKKMLAELGNRPGVWIWDNRNANPLPQMLRQATSIWVTGDSVAMISQAIASDKPLAIIELAGKRRKLGIFRQMLYNSKRAQKFSPRVRLAGKSKVIDDTNHAAQACLKLIGKPKI